MICQTLGHPIDRHSVDGEENIARLDTRARAGALRRQPRRRRPSGPVWRHSTPSSRSGRQVLTRAMLMIARATSTTRDGDRQADANERTEQSERVQRLRPAFRP